MGWPTTNEPKTNFVTIRLTDAEAAELDGAASIAGNNRSAFVRECVRRVIESEKRKQARLRNGGSSSRGNDEKGVTSDG